MGNDISTSRRVDQSNTNQHAHHALFAYDVLSMVFDTLNLQDRRDRATCARSARVCRAWTEPASRVLWSGTRWKLQNLCTILLKHTERPKGVKGKFSVAKIKSGNVRRDGVQRQSLLRCGARVRQLCITQMLQPSPLEVELLRRMLSMGDGATLLPGLLSLSWVEGPRTDGLLLRLLPPSLQELELILDSDTSPKQVHRLFTGLSHPALSIRSLKLYVWKPESFSPDCLLSVSSIHELSLKGDIVLGPGELCKILSGLQLVSIEAAVRNFSTLTEAINGGSLKAIHCSGTCQDLTALVAHLRAPSLNTADLKLDIKNTHFDRTAHHRLSQALLKFSPTLRSLQLDYRDGYTNDRPTPDSWHLPPIALIPDVLAPLLGRLDLESFRLWSELRMTLADSDILVLARSWPSLRSLSLMLSSLPSAPMHRVPTPAALVHLATHCALLRLLRIQLRTESFSPPSQEVLDGYRKLRHPLRTLRQMSMHDTCPLGWQLAEFLDSLFPYLDVGTCEDMNVTLRTERGYNWACIWQHLRAIQLARLAGRELRELGSV